RIILWSGCTKTVRRSQSEMHFPAGKYFSSTKRIMRSQLSADRGKSVWREKHLRRDSTVTRSRPRNSLLCIRSRAENHRESTGPGIWDIMTKKEGLYLQGEKTSRSSIWDTGSSLKRLRVP